MLLGEHAGSKQLWRVAGAHRHRRLGENRALIHPLRHQMDGAAMQLDTGGKRPGMGVETREGGQQAGVNVEHPPGKTGDEKGREQAHIAGEADDLDAVALKLRGDRGLMPGAVAREVAMRDGERRYPMRFRDGQSAGVGEVGDHQRDLGGEGGVARCGEEGGEVGTTPAD